jgi:hypothetical protein
VKRKTSFLIERSKSSVILAIELFNRPSDQGRMEGVLFFLDHAFEMLLKGIVFEKTGRLRGRREKLNYGFDRCLNICESQLHVIDKDEALILRNIDDLRDAAMHDILEMSEGLLYSHAQSAVQIFGALLKKVFNRELSKELPARILPISTSLPKDINTLVTSDLDAVRALLGGRRRREDEAEAYLRPYQIIEQNLHKVHETGGTAPNVQKLIKRMKSGDWRPALPMVAGLVQSTSSGIPLSIHMTKKEGFPVRIDPNAPTALAFRYIKPEDKWPYLTKELSNKLGISSNKFVGLVKLFSLKGNDDYHTGLKVSKTGYLQRYSEKTFQVLNAAIEKEGIDALWKAAKNGEKKIPEDFL